MGKADIPIVGPGRPLMTREEFLAKWNQRALDMQGCPDDAVAGRKEALAACAFVVREMLDDLTNWTV